LPVGDAQALAAAIRLQLAQPMAFAPHSAGVMQDPLTSATQYLEALLGDGWREKVSSWK